MTMTVWREEPTVFAVDRDTSFSQTLRSAVRSLGLRAEFYGSEPEFLQAADPARPGCLVLDPAALRGEVAELLSQLVDRRILLPVIVVSECGDVPAVVAAMRAGAINYLKKPCREGNVKEALCEAIAWDGEHRHEATTAATIRRRMGRLTAGERQVLEMLINGMTNQQVAAVLGLSERAIEARRAKIRHKMRAKNLADLVRQTVSSHGSPATGGPRRAR
jgi:FixJ family two-component response regulator